MHDLTHRPGSRYDVVVVGAGGFGCPIAYHLARSGLSVLVLDRHGIAQESAAMAAGLSAVGRGPQVFNALQRQSARDVAAFTEETGEPLDWVQSGSLLLAHTEEGAAVVERQRHDAAGFDVVCQPVGPPDIAALNPLVRPEAILAATYTPGDLYFEPAQLPRGYARAARRAGAEFSVGAAVTDVLTSGRRVRGVRTSDGDISAAVVIDSAGAWSARLAASAGVRLPMVPVRHQLAITEPLPGVQPTFPTTRFVEAHAYVRPCWGGLLVGGYESRPQFYDALPDTLRVADLPLDEAAVKGIIATIGAHLPALAEAPLRTIRGGIPTMTADGLPLVGPLRDLDGLLVAAGCCVAGLSISPAVGRAVAALVTGAPPGFDLAPLAPDRFEDPGWTEQVLQQSARAQYTHRYAVA